jgi:hypothetical protein
MLRDVARQDSRHPFAGAAPRLICDLVHHGSLAPSAAAADRNPGRHESLPDRHAAQLRQRKG